MPKVTPLTANARMNIVLRSEINAHMVLHGVKHYGELGRYMGGCCSATAYNRMRDLGALRLCELRELVRRLDISPAELIPAIYEQKGK